MSDFNKKFAVNLKLLRKQRRLTQKAFAELVDYSAKTVSKWECGASIPPVETLFKIASILKVSVDDLFKTKSVYYLGIDGGGTKTALALANAEGEIIRTLKTDTCNPVDIGFDKAADILRNAIYEICEDIAFSSVYMYAGIAGGTTADMKQKFRDFFSEFNFAVFENDTDNRNIIAAGLGNNDGMTLILGTGICAFVQKNNEYTKVAGWGYLIDKGGSGYNLGRDALDAYFCALDSSGEETLLTEEIDAIFPGGAQKLMGYIYSGGKKAVASFAPAIFEAVKKGDKVAEEILKRNMRQAAHIVEVAAKKLDDDKKIPVILAGGLTKQDLVIELLRASLDNIEKYEIEILGTEPVYGAIKLARQLKE